MARRPAALPLLILGLVAYNLSQFAPGFVSPVLGRSRAPVVSRLAEPEVVDVEVSELVKLEEDIEAQIQEAEKNEDQSKMTRLSRLLVLTRSSAAATAWQTTKELKSKVGTSMAGAIREFVGKEDYDINDVATKVEERVSSAVTNLENVYLTADAAKSAPEGTTPIILSDVVRPVAGQMKEAGKEAVLAFTGKEDYKFGDISKEAASRAKTAVANLLGQEEYKFGDVTKQAVNKAMDAVSSFTGKEDYKFGDITKSLLRKALDYLESDDEKEKK
ncbi:unnamed protein product [Effrenium voratum]|uniref:Uncharacterized protein n=1 Tax=Effrenium voratum TaxID=2562239 RepID=A0AA36I7R3_9DINO|nr:unnamed protein product [Effrenium voratum]